MQVYATNEHYFVNLEIILISYLDCKDERVPIIIYTYIYTYIYIYIIIIEIILKINQYLFTSPTSATVLNLLKSLWMDGTAAFNSRTILSCGKALKQLTASDVSISR